MANTDQFLQRIVNHPHGFLAEEQTRIAQLPLQDEYPEQLKVYNMILQAKARYNL